MKTVHAREDCRDCHGSGTVYDYVPYGATSVPMPSDCEACALAALERGDLTEEEFDSGDYELVSA